MSTLKKIACLFLLLAGATGISQNDSIWLKKGNLIVGEVKDLSQNVLLVKTSYSDKDFKIEFDKVESISLENNYLIDLVDGQHYFGTIKKQKSDQKLYIYATDGSEYAIGINQIVILKAIDDKFWKRFKGSLDAGLNIAKANNNRQFTFSGQVNYSSTKWQHAFQYNHLVTSQDSTETVERIDWGLDSKRFILNQWYLYAHVSFLSNTEQRLDSRLSPSLGAGKYFVRTNKLFFLAGLGVNYNIERFMDDNTRNNNSTELIIVTQFNMFNFKDLSLNLTASGYPSLSENGRFRADLDFALKYDLPFNFYLKTGFQLNYDNQPAVSGSETDYVLTSGLGWEFN